MLFINKAVKEETQTRLDKIKIRRAVHDHTKSKTKADTKYFTKY